MKHQPSYKPETRIREATPRVKENGHEALILCPFCKVPHPIAVGKPSACGTELRVTAVQTVFPARTVHKRKLVCFKCGKGGGEMVQFNQGFIHLHECMPGTQVLAEPPKNFSPLAGLIYQLPAGLRKVIEKRTGAVKRVDEIDLHGKPTGKTLGYIFYKGAA